MMELYELVPATAGGGECEDCVMIERGAKGCPPLSASFFMYSN